MSYRKLFPLVVLGLFVLALSFIPSSDQRGSGDDFALHFNQPFLDVQGDSLDERIVELIVNVSLPQAEYNVLAELNESFLSIHPRIKVTIVNELPHNQAMMDWQANSALGNASDIMLLDNSLVRMFAIRGYLKPTDGLLAGDNLTNQLPTVIDAVKWNGYLWGVPYMIDPYVWFWNGQAPASAATYYNMASWDEEIRGTGGAVETTEHTLPEGEVATASPSSLIAFNPANIEQLIVFLYQFNESIDRNLLHFREWTNIEFEQIHWLQEQVEQGQVILNWDQHSLATLLQEEKLLAIIMPWSDYYSISKQPHIELLPDSRSMVFPWINGSSYVVAARTKYEKEAMQWIEYMTTLSNQQKISEQFYYLPTILSGYDHTSPYMSEVPAVLKQQLLQKPTEMFRMRADPLWQEEWMQWESLWKDHPNMSIEAMIEVLTNK